jgi:hypothetical protein
MRSSRHGELGREQRGGYFVVAGGRRMIVQAGSLRCAEGACLKSSFHEV